MPHNIILLKQFDFFSEFTTYLCSMTVLKFMSLFKS